MDPVVDAAIVIGATEFVKRLLSRLVDGFELKAELTIVVAGIIGAALAYINGGDLLQGVLIGAAAVGGVTTARNLGGK